MATKKTKVPELDPLTGGRFALAGRIVTMDAKFSVLTSGVVYIDKGRIVAVQGKGKAKPPGFEKVKAIETKATLYPGLVELHNHLSYNVLPLWKVPKRFDNRDQWARTDDYKVLVTRPMGVLAERVELLASVVRYVECKCVFAGVTTSQGLALSPAPGIRKFYRGLLRNVEQTGQKDLPQAATRIADVDAKKAGKFAARLKGPKTLLLHLAEGVDDNAHKHFTSLRLSTKKWAITKFLAGIHCTGLHAEDFERFGKLGGAAIWSPLSNLLLYGDTTKVKAAQNANVRIALGSDWSPTGSKNLLFEMKVARAYGQMHHDSFLTDRAIVEMATRTPADIVGWGAAIGSLEAGKRADLLAVNGKGGDPYSHLIDADESDISLVVINGVPRLGTPELMTATGSKGESLKIGGKKKRLFLEQADANPVVGQISYSDARAALKAALADLPKLDKKPVPAGPAMKNRNAAITASLMPNAEAKGHRWKLALDEIDDNDVSLRPLLGGLTGGRSGPVTAAAKKKLPLVPIKLDPATVVDDPGFLKTLATEANLPVGLVEALGGK